eukprot:GHVH01003980.1.p1 GENE.GHVH01003980.1~~GHVH01003980.1.p1  ORF type:complete len:595 (+),score=73.19 GHVH01003980.1:109-1893(+)
MSSEVVYTPSPSSEFQVLEEEVHFNKNVNGSTVEFSASGADGASVTARGADWGPTPERSFQATQSLESYDYHRVTAAKRVLMKLRSKRLPHQPRRSPVSSVDILHDELDGVALPAGVSTADSLTKMQSMKRLDDARARTGEPLLYYHASDGVFYYRGRLVRRDDDEPEELLVVTPDLKIIYLPAPARSRVLVNDVPSYHDSRLVDENGYKQAAHDELPWDNPEVYRNIGSFRTQVLFNSQGSEDYSPITPKSLIVPSPRGFHLDESDSLSSGDNLPYGSVSLPTERDISVFARGSRRTAKSMVTAKRMHEYPMAKWGTQIVLQKDRMMLNRMQDGIEPKEYEIKERLSCLEQHLKHLNETQLLLIWTKVVAKDENNWMDSQTHNKRSFAYKLSTFLPASVFLRCVLLGLDPLEGNKVSCLFHSYCGSNQTIKTYRPISELRRRGVYHESAFDFALIRKLELLLDELLSDSALEWSWQTIRELGNIILLIQGTIEQSGMLPVNSENRMLLKNIEWWSLGDLCRSSSKGLILTRSITDASNSFKRHIYFNSKSSQVVISSAHDVRKFHYNVHALRAVSASSTHKGLFKWLVVPIDT